MDNIGFAIRVLFDKFVVLRKSGLKKYNYYYFEYNAVTKAYSLWITSWTLYGFTTLVLNICVTMGVILKAISLSILA